MSSFPDKLRQTNVGPSPRGGGQLGAGKRTGKERRQARIGFNEFPPGTRRLLLEMKRSFGVEHANLITNSTTDTKVRLVGWSSDHDDFLRRAGDALASGATLVGPRRIHWDCAGDCERPRRVERTSRPSAAEGRRVTIGPDRPMTLFMDLDVRCRQCSKCRKSKARLWQWRAQHECALWSRTWFGTLTLAPGERYRFLARSKKFADATGDAEFLAVHAEASKAITLWLKRLRKNCQCKFRYLLVTEAHKSGDPHFHLLIHEVEGKLTERQLRLTWEHGYSMFKLVGVDEGSPTSKYICKYLSKSLLARVRASVRYGEYGLGPSDAPAEREKMTPK